MSTRSMKWLILAALTFVLANCGPAKSLEPTVADLQAVHVGVSLSGEPVRTLRRVPEGATIETADDGRGRLRLDDGTVVVVDGGAKLAVKAGHVTLEHGRIFVQGGVDARTEVELGGPVVILTGAHAAVTRPKAAPNTSRVYAASGELTVRAANRDIPVDTGNSAVIRGTEVKVEPERAFDDWTGGLAAPWGASGTPRRVVGELWGHSPTAGDAGFPLTIRSLDVTARIVGESAETEVKAAFFHAGESPVVGDFRMALPRGAIVSGFAAGAGDSPSETSISLATSKGSAAAAKLEWAGDGWVRGMISMILPGSVVTVSVKYVEWLDPQPAHGGSNWILQYRYPLAAQATPPLIGEFSALVDVEEASPKAISAGLGGTIKGNEVKLRKSDFRPTADFVVELEVASPKAPARLYVDKANPDDDAGDFVLVRAQAPEVKADAGVSLVVVVDTSASMDAGMLDSERAFVEALVRALGPRDKLVVLAADETVRPLGPNTMGPVDEARRKAVLAGLKTMAPAGATNIGRALEAAADSLDPGDPAGMVVYIGDGWPSVGDFEPKQIRARLSRRAHGIPRLAAVAVGPAANRFGLTALVRGSGPILEIGDSEEAAASATSLMADALQPAVAGVQLSLGPDVEQVYPLHPRVVASGQTIFAVGRARGLPPKQVTLQWRDPKGAQEKPLKVSRGRILVRQDVRRRWAAARVEELAVRGSGREAAVDVAMRTGLLTPWTAWAGTPKVTPSPLDSRVLDLASGSEAVYSAALATPRLGASVVDFDGYRSNQNLDITFEDAVKTSAVRVLDHAIGAVRACRDSRAALRPDLIGTVEIRFRLNGEGRASDVRIGGSETTYDEALYRCITAVVVGLTFPATGLAGTVEVVHKMELPPGRATGGNKCSRISTLPVALRRGVWLQRLRSNPAQSVYILAKRNCELAGWTHRRALLELILKQLQGVARVGVAHALELAGENDAATFLKREALRRARSPKELFAVRAELLKNERYPKELFEAKYKAAANNQARLAVVRQFLGLAPHDVRLRRQLLVVLEALGHKEDLRREITSMRLDPFADAKLLADCAASLRRAGDEPEARRAFGELVERAPLDPWARAFAGDRLRAEGWFNAAGSVYAPLAWQIEAEQSVLMRVALSHAGAGRVDLASRVLAGVAQVGGRSERADLGELASEIAVTILLDAREKLAKSEKDDLNRRLLELPTRPRNLVLLVRAPAAQAPLEAKLVRGPADARVERKPDLVAPGLGYYRFLVDSEDKSDIALKLAAHEELPPHRAMPIQVIALVPRGTAEVPAMFKKDLELEPTGKDQQIVWKDGAWTIAK